MTPNLQLQVLLKVKRGIWSGEDREIVRMVGVATSAVRFYEEAGLLAEPARTASGYREYDPSVLDRLGFIRAGQAVGLTLGQLQGVLHIRDGGEAPCGHVADLIGHRIGDIDRRIEDLTKLRRGLVSLAGEAKRESTRPTAPQRVCVGSSPEIQVGPVNVNDPSTPVLGSWALTFK